MKKLMMILTLSAGLHAVGANWTNYSGEPPLLLEAPGNWNAAMGETVTATFDPPNGTALAVTTVTGFTNGELTVTAPLSALTFDIPPGRAYSVAAYKQNSAADSWSTVTLQGGGEFVARNGMRLGDTAGSNSLIVTNGASLGVLGADLNMGFNSNNMSNLFHVSNARCEIESSRIFYAGRNGCYNRTIINNNAVLTSGGIRVGGASGGSENTFLIDNAVVTNSATSYVGTGNGSNSNRVEITCGGEWYMPTSVLYVGDNITFGNEVKVTDGGKLNLNDLRIGNTANGGWNTVIAEGAGSSVIVRNSDLTVGQYGSTNSLQILDDALLTVMPNLVLGGQTNSWGNTFLLSNAQADLQKDLRIGAGGNNDHTCNYNEAVIRNGASLVVSNHLSLGYGTMGSHNALLIDQSSVTCSNEVWVGRNGTGNHAEVTNGGDLWTRALVSVGQNANAHGNELKVTEGGTLTANAALTIGNNTGCSNNTMRVESDGTLTTVGMLTVGNNATASGNSFLLSNAQAKVQNSIRVGGAGRDNNAVICDGADFLVASDVVVGYDGSASNNVLIIDNASVTCSNRFMVGRNSNVGNRAEITRGGSCYVHSYLCVGGDQSLAYGNELKVTDNGQLTVNTTMSVGRSAGCSNNVLRVESGGTLTVGSTLTVGDNSSASSIGSNNTMRVENGTVNIGGALVVNHVSSLTLAGTNPVVKVKVASNTAGLTINNGAALRFEFDTVAPTGPLIDVTTRNLAVTNPGAMTIDAEKLARAGGGKDICLIQLGMASSAALISLTNSFNAAASTGRITFRIEDDKRLLCNVAGEGGTLIMVK